MNAEPEDVFERDLRAWHLIDRRMKAADAASAELSMWQLRRRHRARGVSRRLSADLAATSDRMRANEQGGRRLVELAIDVAVRARRASSTRHIYDPRALRPIPGSLLDEVHAELLADLVPAGSTITSARESPVPAALLPLLTRAHVADVIDASVSSVKAMADDPRFVHDFDSGCTTFVVQHVSSGLRATFHRDVTPSDPKATGTFGAVMSKAASIAELVPVPHDPYAFRGLGIGARMYQVAATLDPSTRWLRSSVTNESGAVRTRLHAAAPYRWAAPACAWCVTASNLPDFGQYADTWQRAAPADFLGHPIQAFAQGAAPAVVTHI